MYARCTVLTRSCDRFPCERAQASQGIRQVAYAGRNLLTRQPCEPARSPWCSILPNGFSWGLIAGLTASFSCGVVSHGIQEVGILDKDAQTEITTISDLIMLHEREGKSTNVYAMRSNTKAKCCSTTRPKSALAKRSGQRLQTRTLVAAHRILTGLPDAIEKSSSKLGKSGAREMLYVIGRNPDTRVLCARVHQSFVPWKYR